MKESKENIILEHGSEAMKLPELSFKEERGEILLSILFKAYNQEWGERKHELAGEIEKFFKNYPLDDAIVNFLKSIRALEDGGADEEALYNIALTLDNPGRVKTAAEFIEKNKGNIDNFYYLREKICTILSEVEKKLPQDFLIKLREATDNDIDLRKQNIENTKKQIVDLIEFFKPNPETTKINRINILPTDFFYPEKSGTAFTFDDLLMIRSHIDNPGNLEHEFLHSVINPIVEKLLAKLTDEQKRKISAIGSHRLKIEEKYGEDPESLLCEELIRTYNELIKANKKPHTYEKFEERINKLSEDEFISISKKETEQVRFSMLDITNPDDLKNKKEEYWDKFGENRLGTTIYDFYQKYKKEKEKDPKINFEIFFLDGFSKNF